MIPTPFDYAIFLSYAIYTNFYVKYKRKRFKYLNDRLYLKKNNTEKSLNEIMSASE